MGLLELYGAAKKRIGLDHYNMSPYWGVGPTKRFGVHNVQQAWDKYFGMFDASKEYNVSIPELQESMHRSPEATNILNTYLQRVHSYMGLGEKQYLGFCLGGGYGGFAAAINVALDPLDDQKVFIDVPMPEEGQKKDGHFRNQWALDILRIYKAAGKYANLVFAEKAGVIPDDITSLGVTRVVTVGNDTSNGTVLSDQSLRNLKEFVEQDENNIVVMDYTSLLGSKQVDPVLLQNSVLFTPLQKLLNGPAGFSLVALPDRLINIAKAKEEPSRHNMHTVLNLVVRDDSGKVILEKSPLYDPKEKKIGSVINSFSVKAIMEALYCLDKLPSNADMITQSKKNLTYVRNRVTSAACPFKMHVKDEAMQSASVLLLDIDDSGLGPEEKLTDVQKKTIAENMRAYLGNELGVAKFIAPFRGQDGHIRCWIGGVRDKKEVKLLMDWLEVAFYKAAAEQRGAPLQEETPMPPLEKAKGVEVSVSIGGNAADQAAGNASAVKYNTLVLLNTLRASEGAKQALLLLCAGMLALQQDAQFAKGNRKKIVEHSIVSNLTAEGGPVDKLFKTLASAQQVAVTA